MIKSFPLFDMICCKQIPIPILSIPYKKIVFLHDNLQHLFSARYENSTAWESFDLIVDGKKSALLKHLSELTDWITLLEKTTAINHIKHMYLAVLAPYNQIPWHHDRSDYTFDKSFITSLSSGLSKPYLLKFLEISSIVKSSLFFLLLAFHFFL